MRTHPQIPMNIQTAGNIGVFGVFIVLLGLIGYLTHPDKSNMPLILGGVSGALLVLCGILGARRTRGSKLAALLTTALLGAACVWRASVGWLAVAHGQPEKAFASVIITLMFAAAGVTLVFLLKDRKAKNVEQAAGGTQ